jgi:hypothetical protein
MSFEQLTQHAQEIQAKAIAASLDQHGVRPAPEPGRPPINPMPLEEEARVRITASFADVPALFEPFTMLPEPSSFDGMISDLRDALMKLSSGHMTADPVTRDAFLANPVLTAIGASESYIELWTGGAADAFRTEFVNMFPATVVNQFITCAVLRGALEAYKAIWTSAREDIDKIAHDALNALDNMDHCGQNTWTMTFTVIASVAAVAAVPITAGTSLGALAAATTVTAIGATSQVVAAHQVEPPKVTEFKGETAEVVLDQVRRSVAETIGQIQQAEQQIAGAVERMRATMSQRRELFVSPRPKLADADRGNVRSGEYLGRGR